MTILRDPRPDSITHGKTLGFVSDSGAVIQTKEHWDGSKDAHVKVQALRLHLTAHAPPNPQVVAAVHELEEATREHRLAKHSGNTEWVTYTARRVRAANLRLREVQ